MGIFLLRKTAAGAAAATMRKHVVHQVVGPARFGLLFTSFNDGENLEI